MIYGNKHCLFFNCDVVCLQYLIMELQDQGVSPRDSSEHQKDGILQNDIPLQQQYTEKQQQIKQKCLNQRRDRQSTQQRKQQGGQYNEYRQEGQQKQQRQQIEQEQQKQNKQSQKAEETQLAQIINQKQESSQKVQIKGKQEMQSKKQTYKQSVQAKQQVEKDKQKEEKRQQANYKQQKKEENGGINKAKTKFFQEGTVLAKQATIQRWKYGNGKTADKLTFASWNVNGIRAFINKKELKYFLHKYKPDFFCVNQTKIDRQAYDKLPVNLHGYNNYFNFCKCSSGYSGVAVFSKFMPIRMIEDLPEKELSQEGRVITLEFMNFYLVAVYVPSAGAKLERLQFKTKKFQVSFHEHCEKLKKEKTVIIGGDLNVAKDEIDTHLAKNTHKGPGFTPPERKSFDGFLKKGWVDVWRQMNPTKKEFTWWNIKFLGRQNNVGKRLDYFLIDQASKSIAVDSGLHSEIEGSDHCPITLKVDFSKLVK